METFDMLQAAYDAALPDDYDEPCPRWAGCGCACHDGGPCGWGCGAPAAPYLPRDWSLFDTTAEYRARYEADGDATPTFDEEAS